MFFSILLIVNIPGFASATRDFLFQRELVIRDSKQPADLEFPMIPQEDTALVRKGTESNIPIESEIGAVVKNRVVTESQSESPSALIPSTKSSADTNIMTEQKAVVKKALEVKQVDKETIIRIENLIQNRDSIWGACITGYSTSTYCNRLASAQTQRSAFLIGDSFALSWYPAVEKALSSNWSIRSFTLGECEFSRVVPIIAGRNFDACVKYRAEIDKRVLLEKPDLIIVASSPNTPFVGSLTDWKIGLADRLGFLKDSSSNVLMIGATPGSGKISTCINGNDISKCNGWAKQGLEKKSIELIESRKNQFAFLDPVPLLCFANSCPSVISKTPVYWDGSHMNNEFARTLSPFIKQAINLQYPNLL
jgi:hypothetical protein